MRYRDIFGNGDEELVRQSERREPIRFPCPKSRDNDFDWRCPLRSLPFSAALLFSFSANKLWRAINGPVKGEGFITHCGLVLLKPQVVLTAWLKHEICGG